MANTIEAVIVLWWLTGFEVDRPELRSWADYFRWLIAISLGAWAAGVVTAGTIGLSGEHDLWRPMLWVAVTHMGAQAVLLPLFLRQSRHRAKPRGARGARPTWRCSPSAPWPASRPTRRSRSPSCCCRC